MTSNLTFESGSTCNIGVGAGSSSGNLDVGGTLSLNGSSLEIDGTLNGDGVTFATAASVYGEFINYPDEAYVQTGSGDVHYFIHYAADSVTINTNGTYVAPPAIGSPILWDIGKASNANNMPSVASNFTEAGVSEYITGATVSNVEGAQSMTDGFITVNLSAYTGVSVKNGVTYTGAGASIIREYVYLKDQSAVITIGGLSRRLAPNTEYYLYIWGKGDAATQNGTFSYGGVDITTSTADPLTTDASEFMAKFSFTTDATVADTLDVDWTIISTYTGFNGFAIVAAADPQPTVGEISIDILSSGTNAVLSFATDPFGLYGVEMKTSLSDNSWSDLGLEIDGTGGIVTVTNAVSADVEFYRAFIQD
ncbi:hypothetical protein P4C99_07565 [Pontiellaceae bacterium B1224]|nr:hypothetical protein [Pontiellaceae bacterium B1224]